MTFLLDTITNIVYDMTSLRTRINNSRHNPQLQCFMPHFRRHVSPNAAESFWNIFHSFAAGIANAISSNFHSFAAGIANAISSSK